MRKKRIDDLDILSAHMEEAERRHRKEKMINFVIGFICSVIIVLILIYLYYHYLGPDSKVKNIKITNNHFFSDQQILETAAVDYDDNFYFLSTKEIEKRFESWEICQVKVTKNQKYQVLEIDMDNNDLLAYYNEGNTLYLLDSKGKDYLYTNEYFETLKLLPFMVKFNKEERLLLIETLKPLKREVLYQISEIARYATSYDKNMLELTMEDGNKIYVSRDSILMLDNYNKIVEKLNRKNNCIHFDEMTDSAYAEAC